VADEAGGRLMPTRWTLTAAATALVIHGQIDMTFYDPGAVTWAMCMLGLAGGVSRRTGGRRTGVAVAAGLLLLAVVLSSTLAARAARAQSRMIAAATILYPPAQRPEQRSRQREEAASVLLSAYRGTRSTDATLLREAARQTMIAAQFSTGDRRRELASRAAEFAREAVEVHAGPTSTALLAEAAWLVAVTSGDEAHRQAAIDAAVALTTLDPHGIGPWRRLGDVTWELGARDDAAWAYRRALENDANFELDPMRQLSDRDRELLSRRIESTDQR